MLPAFVLVLAASACAGGGASPPGDPSKPAGSVPATSAAAGASAAAPVERPFASSPAQATELIGRVLDDRARQMRKCVADLRTRKNLPHERVEISVGIDQNGTLIGATLKKPKTADPAFDSCVQAALSGAPFPKSQAGIITMTKSYEDIVQ